MQPRRMTLALIAALAIGVQAMSPTSALASSQDVPRYPVVNSTCDAKYGKEHVIEGFVRYMHSVLDDMIQEFDPELKDQQISIDTDNDFLCWMPLSIQPLARYVADGVTYAAYETIPNTAARLP